MPQNHPTQFIHPKINRLNIIAASKIEQKVSKEEVVGLLRQCRPTQYTGYIAIPHCQ
jgi:hypothetical protein